MSLNLFSTTLGYVIFLPPSKGGPGGGGYHLYPYKFAQLLSAEVFPALQAWQEVGRGSLWTGSFNHEARNKTPPQRIAQKNHPARENFGWSFLLWNCCIIICSTVVYSGWWFGEKCAYFFVAGPEWTLGKCMPWRSWMCVPLQMCLGTGKVIIRSHQLQSNTW